MAVSTGPDFLTESMRDAHARALKIVEREALAPAAVKERRRANLLKWLEQPQQQDLRVAVGSNLPEDTYNQG